MRKFPSKTALAFALAIAAALPAGLAAGLTGTGPALAGDEAACGDAPRDQWMSEEAIKAKASEMGYEVRRVKIEDGCYEAYAIDKDGKKVEVYMNPVTGAVVKSKMDD